MGGTIQKVVRYESLHFLNLLKSCTSKCQTVWLCVCRSMILSSVFGSVRQTCFYIQCSCPSLVPSPSCVSLAVSDGGSAAQLDDHLLAVVKGPLVSQLLQGASCVGQHAHPLARSRQKGGGKVAACQHHSLRLLPLAWPRLALLCLGPGCCSASQ